MSKNERLLEKLVQKYMDEGDPSLYPIIQAYIRLGRAFGEKKINQLICDEYEWSSEEVRNKLDIKLVFLLIENCEDFDQLAWVAAGPLKDIIQRDYKKMPEILDIMARKSTKMRSALEAVLMDPSDKSYPLLRKLINKYGLIEGSL